MLTNLLQTFRVYLQLLFFLVLFFQGCAVTGQDNGLINLKQEQVAFHSEIEVQFTNTLDYGIAILTVGCSNSDDEFLPSHVIEKLEDKKWSRAGAPICIAIASPPILLEPGDSHSISIPVDIGLEEAKIPGTFRFRFDIRKVSEGENPTENKLEEELMISPSFRITNG